MGARRIALVGDRNDAITAHRAIPLALGLCAESLALTLSFDWLASDALPDDAALAGFAERLATGPLRATAHDAPGEVRALELDGHPFFVGTLFQPERAALRGVVPPVVRAFVQATGSAASRGATPCC